MIIYSYSKWEWKRAKGIGENTRAGWSLLYYKIGLNPSTDPANMGTGPSETTRKIVTIGGQAMANALPLTQAINIYTMGSEGKDIWGRNLNTLGYMTTIASPLLWFLRITPTSNTDLLIGTGAVGVDVGNSIYDEK